MMVRPLGGRCPPSFVLTSGVVSNQSAVAIVLEDDNVVCSDPSSAAAAGNLPLVSPY